MNNTKPLVTIRCLVYNHEPFLRDCLEGFVMQHASFPFEAVVHDDASTDNSAAIIMEYAEKYPNIIKPIIETENQHSKHDRSLRRIMNEACTGKYIAWCEGDDYWTDPYKLQRQIEYLESHPECSMSFHAVNVVKDGAVVRILKHSIKEVDFSTNRIISMGGSYVPSPSIVVRRNLFYEYPKFRNMADVGDYPLQVYAAIKGAVHYFPEIMGCYRIHGGSWTASVSPEKNIGHLQNRIAWLKELDKYTNGEYRSAVFFSIIDSAVALYKQKQMSKKELLDIFHKVNIFTLDVAFNSKKNFVKQYLSALFK